MANENWQAVSPLVIPEIMQLFNQAKGAVPAPGSLQGVNDFVQQGVNSPLLQAILGPAMANLRAGQGNQRTAMADQFRAAGGLRSSQYGRSIVDLEGELSRQEGNLISQMTSQTLSPLLQGLLQQQQQQFMPAQTLAQILGAVRPDVHFGQQGAGAGAGGAGGTSRAGGGGGTGGGGGFGGFGTDSFWSDNDPYFQQAKFASNMEPYSNVYQPNLDEANRLYNMPYQEPIGSTWFSPNGDYASGGDSEGAFWNPPMTASTDDPWFTGAEY